MTITKEDIMTIMASDIFERIAKILKSEETWASYQARREFIAVIRQRRDERLKQSVAPASVNPFDRLYESWGPANFVKMLPDR